MTLALEIRMLTGRYAATAYNDRQKPEWPPHPARVYSALVAALYDDPDPGDDERQALEWLASAGPPEVLASDTGRRHQSEVYVPPNDNSALTNIDRHIKALSEAEAELEHAGPSARQKMERARHRAEEALRKRSLATAEDDGKGSPGSAALVLDPRKKPQPRTFPVALPHDEVVCLRWPSAPPPPIVAALDRVASRVVRLGHSSSLVSMRFVGQEIPAGERRHWTPDEDGDLVLRVATDGQLQRLDDAYQRHRGIEPRLLPAGFVAYTDGAEREEPPPPASCFDDRGWLTFEVVAPPGKRRRLLDVSLAQQVARALRGALMAADDPWPEVLSGHAADGTPSCSPHLAFVPLADVGHPHATGSILGVALVLPRELPADARRALLTSVGRAERAAARDGEPTLRLTLGRYGTLLLRRPREASPLRTLTSRRWTEPAHRWVSATAIALGHNPGNLYSRDPAVVARAVEHAEQTVSDAVTTLGLPRPAAVWVHPRSLLEGAPVADRFMPFPARGGPRRVCVHAEIVFDEPVTGPVLLGAGRYFGLGLCSPHDRR